MQNQRIVVGGWDLMTEGLIVALVGFAGSQHEYPIF